MKIGRYTVVGTLGAGAMAEVHAARLEGPGGFSRRAAIKRVRPHLLKHPGVHEMLVTEGRLAAVLEHACILQVYELLDEGGEFALVMEYADAGSLQRLVDAARASGKPIPWPIVAAIGADVASALAYAHQLTDVRGAPMNVVHRDVSPSNILLTSSGGVKLADFGIAAARGALGRGFAGESAGKPDYMPREQALGLPSTDRVDVFALGAVLYELLTLERPFPRGHRHAVEAQARARPLVEARPDAPAPLRDAVERALADEPGERPTAEWLAVLLRKVQEPVAGGLAAGGLARYLAQHVPPVVPAPVEDTHAVPTPLSTPQVQRPPGRLFGRAEELDALLARFSAGARAVAIVGAPGLGKSLLAQHLAAAGEERWPRRWLVPVQEAAPPWGLALALSRALGVPLDTSAAPAEALARLGDVLAARTKDERGLLVLDGVEAFGAALRQAAPSWLEKAPRLELLLTSTERPGFGEAIQLEPLPAAAARALFLDRAPQQGVGGDDEALGRLLDRLEGVPLALEWAAAALKTTTPAALEANLSAGASLAAAQGLSEALDALLGRLSEPEQAALAQLAVFSGGFTVPAASAVVQLPEGAPAFEVVLERLLQRSLVRRLPGTSERHGLYEVLRAWGLARLDAKGERAEVTARHTAWYLAQGVRWAEGAGGRLAATLGDTLLAELPNLLAVHLRALEALPMTAADAANALTAAVILDAVLALRGPHGLLLSLLDSALSAAAGHPVHPGLLSRARLARGSLLRELGRLADAEADLGDALRVAEEVGDERLERSVRNARASLYIDQTRYELAVDELTHAEALAVRRGDRRGVAMCEGQRALLALERGELDAALALYRKTMGHLAELGDRRLEALGSGHLAALYLEQGHLGDARDCFDLACSLLDGAGDVCAAATFAGYRALADLFEEHLDPAAAGFLTAIGRLQDAGELRFSALFEACLGVLHVRRAELDAAEHRLDAARARLEPLAVDVFLDAIAVHRQHLEVARGRPLSVQPPQGPVADNDVRLAWLLLRRFVTEAASAGA